MTRQMFESGDYFFGCGWIAVVGAGRDAGGTGPALLSAVGADAANFCAAYCDFYSGVFCYLAF
jgi:hypothetical protein